MSGIGAADAQKGSVFIDAFTNLRTPRVMPLQVEPSGLTVNSFNNQGKVAEFLPKLRSRLEKFHSVLKTNSFLSDSFTWKIKTARVSERDKMLAKASSKAAKAEYSVDVDRLARTRTAVSSQLRNSEITDFEMGTYSFDLTVGSNSYAIEVNVDKTVSDPDTNKDVLQKVQAAIQGLNENIEVSVSEVKRRDYNQYAENVYKRVSFLTIKNKATGEDVLFSLQDTSGNMLETLGLDKIRSYGSKSQYTVNGKSAASDSNIVSLENNKLDALLLNTTTGNRTVSVKVRGGLSVLEKELHGVVADYNSMIDWLDDNKRYISPTLKRDIFTDIDSLALKQKNISGKKSGNRGDGEGLSILPQVKNSGSFDTKLAAIGLKLDNDGRLEISDDFASALENDLASVHETLAGEDGLFSKIGSAVDFILNQSGAKYILEKSHYLSYDSEGEGGKNVYRESVSQMLNIYA